MAARTNIVLGEWVLAMTIGTRVRLAKAIKGVLQAGVLGTITALLGEGSAAVYVRWDGFHGDMLVAVEEIEVSNG